MEKEVLGFALTLNRSLTPQDVCLILNIGNEKARQILQAMMLKKLLQSAGKGQQRVRCYQVNPLVLHEWEHRSSPML
ncbi:hypothetical protein [Paenibacillus sp. N3.4]|uniref:hypothetical protein n=1 Tax=Paenibacillus sp. N3.4 TaxID=2603222 RepID=UPI00164F40B6|nr:hypothetical protein [Paenibacillus sp. N3.4]